MILKRLLGKVMIEMGFVTSAQLEEALRRQKQILEEKSLPERLKRAELVSESRLAAGVEMTPLLGQILVEMKLVTPAQLARALREQEEMLQAYSFLESEKLGSAIEIGSLINSTLNLAEVLALTMRHVNRVTNSVASTLMLLDDITGELIFSVPTGPKADKLIDIRIPSGKGIAGWVAESLKPALVPDVKKDSRFYPEVDKISGFETRSILCVPLIAKTKCIGVLEAMNKVDGQPFDDEDVVLLSIFASQAALAIENARLYCELKHHWEQDLRMQKKLAEVQKFRALVQMGSGVAHDFNNLLMGIQGNVSLMFLDLDDNHPHYKKLKNIEHYVQSGAELTKQLLGFAKGGKFEVTATDLNELVETTARMFGRTKKEIKIHKKSQENLWTVEVDRGQIEQVILNLYVNAWQAMPGGGELRLKTENVLVGDELAGPYPVKPGRYVKISVSDTGIGMNHETTQRIFEPFFTTKEAGIGTGLGLSSAYGIIKNHGGFITVKSKKGEGTTFEIYLPTSDKKLFKEKSMSEELIPGTERILLVDDEDMILDVGKQMLERMGYEVMVATNGREAVEILEQEKETVDLVILDMIMPDMSGGQVFDRIKEARSDMRVLLSSGYGVDGEAAEILERGCDGFVQKPFNIKHLSQKIREVLDGPHQFA